MNQKIKDGARQSLEDFLIREEGYHIAKARYLADQILSIWGEADEVCDECEGGKETWGGNGIMFCFDTCPTCKGTGHKLWHIKVEVEDG